MTLLYRLKFQISLNYHIFWSPLVPGHSVIATEISLQTEKAHSNIPSPVFLAKSVTDVYRLKI